MILSIAEAILEAAQALRRAGVPEARIEAGRLLAHVLERDRTFLITHAEDLLAIDETDRFRDCVARRESGEPFQYIVGCQGFFGLDFEVNSDVLIPRPETEILVEAALDVIRDGDAPLVCDIGTGSGCIPIALLHERPVARAIAVDISEAALSVAARNAARHEVCDRIAFIASDCFAAFEKGKARFDLIVSNPPYVAEKDLAGLQREVREHEPRAALTSGEDGLSVIRRLLNEASAFLTDRGHLLMEIGFDQHEAVASLIDEQVWKLIQFRDDLQGIPRIVVLENSTA
jgi:release factor glutamine methyltransferase